MSTQVVHRLVGYDRMSGRAISAYDLPAKSLPQIYQIVAIDEDDPDAIASYEVTWEQAKSIAKLLGFDLTVDYLDFFLEPFAEPQERRASA